MERHDEQTTQRLVSVAEALRVLPVSREALYRKLKSGELPSFRFGQKILVDVGQIIEAMRQAATCKL